MAIRPGGAIFGRVVSGALLLSGGGLGYAYSTDEGTRRSVKLWTNVGPVIAHYRLLELKQKYMGPEFKSASAELEWDALHQKYAGHVLKTLQDLKGFYVKIGQVLASRQDMLPDLYLDKLRTLEDNVPHSTDAATIENLMKKSLGVEDLREIFLEFDVEKPLGMASIGQVFRAKLKENHADVAVKVQTPGMEVLFREDIKTARAFCTLMAPEQVIVFNEIEKQFMTEFDYRREAEQLEMVRENMKRFKEVVVPKPYRKWCTKEVLVMEFLEGPKLIDGIKAQGRRWAARKGLKFEDLQRQMRQKYEREGLPPPYDGPSSFRLELYRKFVRARDALVNSPALVYNNLIAMPIRLLSLGFVDLPRISRFESFIPLNSARIMETLLKVHGHQVLVNGYFNADCHAGNFLLMADGRLGLIDYGNVKRLSSTDRLALVKLFAAMHRKDKERIIKLVIANGYVSKYYNPEVMLKMVTVVLDQDGSDVTGGLNIQQFMDRMYEKDPWKKTGDLIIMPARCTILLRSIGLMLNNPVSIVHVWGPIAEEALRLEGIDYDSI